MDREELRLKILIILYLVNGYTANQEMLIKELKKRGIIINRDQLKIELSWLDNQANAIVDENISGVHIATLTGDGMEICEGTRVVPGIRRPRPEELV